MARILVIDDNVALLRAMGHALTDAGHQVTLASGGMDGMRRWREVGADVVFMDIHMPDFDGIELLTQFQTVPPTVPVIMMSGGQQTSDLDLLGGTLLLGARATLPKPFTLDELSEVLRRVLGQAGPEGQDAGRP
jgi:CheY-like chemotaxis protein